MHILLNIRQMSLIRRWLGLLLFISCCAFAGENDPWFSSYPPATQVAAANTLANYIWQQTGEFKSENVTLKTLLEKSFKDYAAHPAYTGMQQTLTYREVDKYSQYFAHYLKSLGLKKGDRVAVMMPNSPHYPVVTFGIIRAGLVMVPIIIDTPEPSVVKTKLIEKLGISSPKVLVALNTHAQVVNEAEVREKVNHLVVAKLFDFGTGITGFVQKHIAARWVNHTGITQDISREATLLEDAFKIGKSIAKDQKKAKSTHAPEPEQLQSSDIVAFYFTGGTTGIPKAVEISHANVVANVMQIHSLYGSLLTPGKEVFAVPLPMTHAFGFLVGCIFGPFMGAHHIVVPNARDIEKVIDVFKKPVSVTFGVDKLFTNLAGNPRFASLNFTSLKLVIGGATAILKSTFELWENVTGNCLTEGYGMSEAVAGVTVNPPGKDKVKTGTAGIPFPWTEIRLVKFDPADKTKYLEDATGDETGEIWIKGPQVARGYYNNPEETAETFKDGWLRSGDVGKFDSEGYLSIVDRKKDMILVGGKNVFPSYVEDRLNKTLGIECASIGIPKDEKQKTGGDQHILYAVYNGISLDQIKQGFTQAGLEKHEYPQKVIFIDQIPRTAIGKVLRNQLRTCYKTMPNPEEGDIIKLAEQLQKTL